jgi:hypothetical protein
MDFGVSYEAASWEAYQTSPCHAIRGYDEMSLPAGIANASQIASRMYSWGPLTPGVTFARITTLSSNCSPIVNLRRTCFSPGCLTRSKMYVAWQCLHWTVCCFPQFGQQYLKVLGWRAISFPSDKT